MAPRKAISSKTVSIPGGAFWRPIFAIPGLVLRVAVIVKAHDTWGFRSRALNRCFGSVESSHFAPFYFHAGPADLQGFQSDSSTCAMTAAARGAAAGARRIKGVMDCSVDFKRLS